MARADLLLALARAASRGGDPLARPSLEAIIAEERQKQHHVLAGQLTELLTNNEKPQFVRNGSRTNFADLLLEVEPRVRLEDLILDDHVRQLVADFVQEQLRQDLLRSYGLEPRSKLLLEGPPGNGKTSLAEGIAEKLSSDLLVLKYESVIGSYLGETGTRLAEVFAHARTRRCVLFLDEFDTLGKERGDPHDTGEVKRVVSSLLLQIDALPSYVVVIAATNHPELLDRAAARRFDLILRLNPPTPEAVELWLDRLEERSDIPVGAMRDELESVLNGLPFSALDQFGKDLLRHRVLSPTLPTATLVKERLRAWKLWHDSGR